jgi:hypothetical protein
MITPNSFNFAREAHLENPWRSFLVDFFCGVAIAVWYLLVLAEKFAFRGLIQLEEIAAPASRRLPAFRFISHSEPGELQPVWASSPRSLSSTIARRSSRRCD